MNQTVKTAALRVGAKSHVGKVRGENQDRMGRFPSPLGELYIVVDGMGGHKGGALAAAMTIDGLDAYLKSIPPGVPPEQALQDAAQRTNSDIYQKANDGDSETASMGATLVLALVRNRQIIVAHAGDSRAYRFRAGRLKRLTRDHSVVQRMIDHNMITEEQARDHPDASVITRAFGQKPEIELEVSPPLDLQDGDGILLCSDGLCGYVDDAAIERVIRRYSDAQQITDALIELALSAGGEDNVTVQFLQYGERKRRAMAGPAEAGREATDGHAANQLPLVLGLALVSAAAVLLTLVVLFLTGVIGWGSLFHPSSNAKNVNASVNQISPVNGNENKPPENANAASAAVANPIQPPAPNNTNQNPGGGSEQGQAPPNAASPTVPANGSPAVSPAPTSQDAAKPRATPKPFMGIPLPSPPDPAVNTADAEKKIDELYSIGGRKILYLFYDPERWLDKGIYFLKPEVEQDAKTLAQKVRGKWRVQKLPDDVAKTFAKDFEGYDIIICP